MASISINTVTARNKLEKEQMMKVINKTDMSEEKKLKLRRLKSESKQSKFVIK